MKAGARGDVPMQPAPQPGNQTEPATPPTGTGGAANRESGQPSPGDQTEGAQPTKGAGNEGAIGGAMSGAE